MKFLYPLLRCFIFIQSPLIFSHMFEATKSADKITTSLTNEIPVKYHILSFWDTCQTSHWSNTLKIKKSQALEKAPDVTRHLIRHWRKWVPINTLGLRQHRRRFADDIFKCIFCNVNCCILINISLKFVRKGPIDNNPALVQIMAWRRLGDKPFSEPMMVSLLTHVCFTRPQWVKENEMGYSAASLTIGTAILCLYWISCQNHCLHTII